MTTHLSEGELQEYTLLKAELSTEKAHHFASCSHCQALAANYRIIVSELHHLPKPSFDFDVSAAVMVKIQNRKEAYSVPVMLACLFSLFLMVAAVMAVYTFREELAIILINTTPLITLFTLSTVVIISGFYGVTLLYEYQKKLRTLNLT